MQITLVKNKINGWLKNKGYSHFDRPISLYKEKDSIKKKNLDTDSILNLYKFLSNPILISKHSFHPFVGYDLVERKISRIKNKRNPKKLRPIRYASHMDGYIYSYYAHNLSVFYEKKLKDLGLERVVSAYRKTKENENPRNNVLMAKEVFEEIKRRGNNCIALAVDIEGFYDNIDHKKLKEEWEKILNVNNEPNFRLDKDVYKVYLSLTEYRYIEIKDLCVYFNRDDKLENKKYICYCKNCTLPSKNLVKRKKLPNPIFSNPLKYREFRKWYKKQYNETFRKNEGLIKDVKNPFGIPQGSAMSSLLSNIYMIPFDLRMNNLADELGGMYRRYADDIIFICDKKHREKVEKEIKEAIQERGPNLKIHDIDDNNRASKSQCHDFGLQKIKQLPLKYLGFAFDGTSVSIREESLSRYFRKSKRGVSSILNGAKVNLRRRYIEGRGIEEKHKKLFRKRAYENYTHLGKRNFIYYANESFNTMDDKKIKEQVKKHYNRIQKLLEDADSKLKKFLQNEGYKKDLVRNESDIS